MGFCVIVHSMGCAGAGLIRTLRPVSKLSDRELAKRLLQAPSVVLENLEKSTAEEVARLLADTGAEVSCQPADQAFEPGTGEYEIAVSFNHYLHTDKIIKTVAELLGLSLEKSAALLARTPAVLISQVSRATLELFQQRLEPLGLEVDASRPHHAHYDIYCKLTDGHNLERLRRTLRDQAIPTRDEPESPLLATDIPFAPCQRLWQTFERSASPLIILNQDYQRYDIQLHNSERNPAMDRVLTNTFQIPATVVDRLYTCLPMLIARSIHRRQLPEKLLALEQEGAAAEAHLTAFQTFSLELHQPLTPQVGAPLLSLITSQPREQCQHWLNSSPRKLAGPFNNHQARWLQAELKKLGMQANLKQHSVS